MDNKLYFCDYCYCFGEENGSSPLLTHRGARAPWMSKTYHRILFCPLCGQIFVQLTEDSELSSITIDEFEFIGN